MGSVALLNMHLIDRVTSEKGATSEAERAALLGVDLATLWRWRNNKTDIRVSTLYRIADAIGVDVRDLLLVRPQPPSPPPPGPRPPAGPHTPPPPSGPKAGG